MKTLLLILMLSLPALAQTVVEKRTGEVATLTCCGAEGDQVHYYRKTSPAATPWRIGTKPRTPGVFECIDLRYLMPSGTTPEYRFFATPQQGTEMLNDTAGVKIKRVK